MMSFFNNDNKNYLLSVKIVEKFRFLKERNQIHQFARRGVSSWRFPSDKIIFHINQISSFFNIKQDIKPIVNLIFALMFVTNIIQSVNPVFRL